MDGNLEAMKAIYKIMENKGMGEEIKKWRDSSDDTALIKATRFGRVKIVEWLLEEVKVDVNEKRIIGDTALHTAARCNQLPCARVLLKHQAKLFKTYWGETPLDELYIGGQEEGYRIIGGRKEMENLLKTHFNLN